MTQTKNGRIPPDVHPVCCGIDVHKKIVVACILSLGKNGKVEKVIKEFGTFTDDIVELKAWPLEFECPMEGTGVCRQPLHNVLEDAFEIVPVNAGHMKNVPGRKTDVSDSRRIAELLGHGLLKSSFIPPKHVGQWRDPGRLKKRQISTLSSIGTVFIN